MPCALISRTISKMRVDDHRREAERRLVEQQQLGLRHQRAADREHLLLAAGQRPALLLLALLQAREERVDAVEVLADALLVACA